MVVTEAPVQLSSRSYLYLVSCNLSAILLHN